jgi:hypothetical protein
MVCPEGLGSLHRSILSKGVYSPISAGCVQQWTHPLTLSALEEDGLLYMPPPPAAAAAADKMCGAVRDGATESNDSDTVDDDHDISTERCTPPAAAAASPGEGGGGSGRGMCSAASLCPRLNRNAAVVGFSLDDTRALQLLREWDRLCHKQEVVAPVGSDRSNHRQDQAVLSILFYSMGWDEVYGIDEGEGTEQSVSLYNA